MKYLIQYILSIGMNAYKTKKDQYKKRHVCKTVCSWYRQVPFAVWFHMPSIALPILEYT